MHTTDPLLDKKAMDFLKSYLETYSPTGFESPGQKTWYEYIKPYVQEGFVDHYGTTVGVINPGKEYKVVIEAHADEISWFVHYITKEGFIYVRRNGGSDHQIAPSKDIIIHTDNGPVEGVFGWPAIHVRKNETEKKPTLENIFIDIGARDSDEVAAMGVQVGDVITFTDPFRVLNSDKFVGRALDNRIGGFMIAQVARMIHENKIDLPFSLYVVNSVQEEVGLYGAQMITDTIKPNVAIITDVTHCTESPMYDKKLQGDIGLGKGPVVSVGPAVHNNLRKLIETAAKEHEIKYQRLAASRYTGTDTDAFAFSNGGVPSALISLPERYMHTTVEMVHKDDVEAVIRLIYASVQQIKDGQDFRYWTIDNAK